MRSRARPLLSTRMATRRGVSAAAKLQVQEEVVDDADMADELRRSATLLSATAVGMLLPSGLALADNPEVVNPFFTFSPVCPASDGIFRVGQRAALGIAGTDNIEDYRPLINDVLIRVRTELCVLESFVRETATPFIQQKGVGWILPLHETSETYLAGVVFMVGANFILLGSTKVVAILSIYHDLALGIPTRALGGLLSFGDPKRREMKYEKELEKLLDKQADEVKNIMRAPWNMGSREEKVAECNSKYQASMEEMRQRQELEASKMQTSAVGKFGQTAAVVAVPLRLYGQGSALIRTVLEAFDTFCSRYFVALTVAYIVIKTGHYVLLPNFP